MLYANTRNRIDSYTPYRVLHENFASDGGAFVPLRLTQLSNEALQALRKMTFGEAVAFVLHYFFSIELNPQEVDLAIGKKPFRLQTMNHKLFIAELWRNPKGEYAFVEQSLYSMISGSFSRPTDWAKIAIRVSILFGIYTELVRIGVQKFDLCVEDVDFLEPMAGWYAKKLGLPIDTLIYCCDDSCGAWDFLCRGEFRPDGISRNSGQGNPTAPLERLIYELLGRDELRRYLDAVTKGKAYNLSEESTDVLKEQIVVSVMSGMRKKNLVRSIYRTNDYLTDMPTAAALSGLQDYRSRSGEGRLTLILSDYSPLCYSDMLQNATGLSVEELKRKIN